MNLNDVLSDEAQRASIVEDICRLVDTEVGKQRGISGIAVKAGYKLVQGVKPGFVRNVVRRSSRFASRLSPRGRRWAATSPRIRRKLPKPSLPSPTVEPKNPSTGPSKAPTASFAALHAKTSKAQSPA